MICPGLTVSPTSSEKSLRMPEARAKQVKFRRLASVFPGRRIQSEMSRRDGIYDIDGHAVSGVHGSRKHHEHIRSKIAAASVKFQHETESPCGNRYFRTRRKSRLKAYGPMTIQFSSSNTSIAFCQDEMVISERGDGCTELRRNENKPNFRISKYKNRRFFIGG